MTPWDSNPDLAVLETAVLPVTPGPHIVPFHLQTENAVGTLHWNHGTELNRHTILSAACGDLPPRTFSRFNGVLPLYNRGI